MGPQARSATRAGGTAMAIVGIAALGACGDGEPSSATPSETTARTGDEDPDTASQARRPEDGDGAVARVNRPDVVHPVGCAFTAPPGRLAEAVIPLTLDGAPCQEARALARAAALGQPAGANLAIDARGYRCEPSTTARGVNVTYTCKGEAGSASFRVVWARRS